MDRLAGRAATIRWPPIKMQRPSWRNFDPFLIVFAVVLVAYGLTVISSATRAEGVAYSGTLARQAAIASFGVALMVGLSFVDYRVIGQVAPFLYVGTLAILAVVLGVGTLVFGAQRWLEIGGVRLQPSEPAKLVAVIVLARLFAGRSGEASTTGTTEGPPVTASGTLARTNLLGLGVIAPIVVLVYVQPDLGTSLVVLSAYFSVAYVAGVPHAILGGLASVPMLGFPVVWSVMKPYMRNRITTFLAPDRDPLGEGYNLIQARISVGSGGWVGRGLGNGTQTQLNFLRVQHTDFIFAVIGEELGFVGGVGLILLYGLLLWRCLRVLVRSRDAFGRYLVGGITGTIAFQAFVNIGMNVGLLPVTGIPLPFISSGGSSLLTLFAALGIVQSVLVHSQARRYDSRPSVGVPARSRLRAGRFALPEVGHAVVDGLPAGSLAAVPAWGTLDAFDVPDAAAAARGRSADGGRVPDSTIDDGTAAWRAETSLPPRPRGADPRAGDRGAAWRAEASPEALAAVPRGERLRWRADDSAAASSRRERDASGMAMRGARRRAPGIAAEERAALRLRGDRTEAE
jgi:rod shape determining protein RodA